jgi:hypothetical protein
VCFVELLETIIIRRAFFLSFPQCLADVEAFIDFSEDENIEEETLQRGTVELN